MVLIVVLAYLCLLLLISRLVGKKGGNDAFFRANRRSPWWMVAFGMIGASISGVTFVSVPGMVLGMDMTYIQTCLGFIVGYFVVAFVLLPLYYRMNLTTIYGYLRERLGLGAYQTGAGFFVLSKLTSTAVKFYLFCAILQRFVFDEMGVPFVVTASAMVALVWLYTRRGGIKMLVWTDTLQTLCMLVAVCLIIYKVTDELGFGLMDAAKAVAADSHSRIFVWDDWVSTQNFWKQFVSGVFIVVVMTGLDQDMMQKNLTCRTLRDAQKDMCTYGFAFVPVNLLFLSLGVLLMMLAAQRGVTLPTKGDELLPMFAATGGLGETVVVLFTLGMVATSFSTADSALTALTTCFCVDICRKPADEKLRHRVFVGMAVLMIIMMMLFRWMASGSVIDAIYTLVSYTYGPLLGLFVYAYYKGARSKGKEKRDGSIDERDKKQDFSFVPCLLPLIPCLAAPLLCFGINQLSQQMWGYRFGYELLMLNGLLTFFGLWLVDKAAVAADS